MTALEQRPEPGAAVGNELGDSPFEDVPAVAGDLFAAADQQVTGWEAVTGEVAVHVGGGCVTGLAGVDHEDTASGAGQERAADRPAAPPPITATSYGLWFMSITLSGSATAHRRR